MGKPSKQVAIAEEEPGIPISTAEIKVPDTPPIQIASSSTNEVSVERPKVTGSSRAIPSVAESPGIAPKHNTQRYHCHNQKKIDRLQACHQCTYVFTHFVVSPLFKQNSGRQLNLEAIDKHGVQHSRHQKSNDNGRNQFYFAVAS